ncbi:MAG: ATP-binding cassette domain-containing protein, partial [Paludibacteraceae bacterium]|nr:ATP-binding cassette domain-containing protein [Paludibacteraceae bacterium]
ATKLNINHRLEHKPNELSGGEKQRIAVIRSLIMNPKIILADEPTGSLDSKNKIELQNILWNIRDEYKKTIVIVTHDKELAQKSDRIIEIQDGKIYEK